MYSYEQKHDLYMIQPGDTLDGILVKNVIVQRVYSVPHEWIYHLSVFQSENEKYYAYLEGN